MPIQDTCEQRRGPHTHLLCWTDHPPLHQGGGKRGEQLLQQCSTWQAFCPTGYSLDRHTVLNKGSLLKVKTACIN